MATVYETQRLRVRRWHEADLERLFEIYSNLEVAEHVPDLRVRQIEEMEERLPKIIASYTKYGEGYGVWAAERKEDGATVGTVMLKHLPDGDGNITEDVEVGWHLAREWWGHGYATEMAAGALAYGFEQQGDELILAVTSEENLRSLAVMERLGMVHRGSTDAYYGMECVLYDISVARWSSGRRSYL